MAKNGKAGKGTRGSRARRGKSEDFTGAAEAKVETRAATPASELDLPKPDDLAYHKKTITGYREQVSSAQGRLRNAIKAAKKSGIDMWSLDQTIAAERENDPVAVRKRFEQLAMGFRESGLPIQITVHDTLAGDVTEAAYKRGFEAGKNGQTLNNVYPKGSDLAEQYATGWRNGMASNVKGGTEAVQNGEADEVDEADGDGIEADAPPAPIGAAERREPEFAH